MTKKKTGGLLLLNGIFNLSPDRQSQLLIEHLEATDTGAESLYAAISCFYADRGWRFWQKGFCLKTLCYSSPELAATVINTDPDQKLLSDYDKGELLRQFIDNDSFCSTILNGKSGSDQFFKIFSARFGDLLNSPKFAAFIEKMGFSPDILSTNESKRIEALLSTYDRGDPDWLLGKAALYKKLFSLSGLPALPLLSVAKDRRKLADSLLGENIDKELFPDEKRADLLIFMFKCGLYREKVLRYKDLLLSTACGKNGLRGNQELLFKLFHLLEKEDFSTIFQNEKAAEAALLEIAKNRQEFAKKIIESKHDLLPKDDRIKLLQHLHDNARLLHQRGCLFDPNAPESDFDAIKLANFIRLTGNFIVEIAIRWPLVARYIHSQLVDLLYSAEVADDKVKEIALDVELAKAIVRGYAVETAYPAVKTVAEIILLHIENEEFRHGLSALLSGNNQGDLFSFISLNENDIPMSKLLSNPNVLEVLKSENYSLDKIITEKPGWRKYLNTNQIEQADVAREEAWNENMDGLTLYDLIQFFELRDDEPYDDITIEKKKRPLLEKWKNEHKDLKNNDSEKYRKDLLEYVMELTEHVKLIIKRGRMDNDALIKNIKTGKPFSPNDRPKFIRYIAETKNEQIQFYENHMCSLEELLGRYHDVSSGPRQVDDIFKQCQRKWEDQHTFLEQQNTLYDVVKRHFDGLISCARSILEKEKNIIEGFKCLKTIDSALIACLCRYDNARLLPYLFSISPHKDAIKTIVNQIANDPEQVDAIANALLRNPSLLDWISDETLKNSLVQKGEAVLNEKIEQFRQTYQQRPRELLGIGNDNHLPDETTVQNALISGIERIAGDVENKLKALEDKLTHRNAGVVENKLKAFEKKFNRAKYMLLLEGNLESMRKKVEPQNILVNPPTTSSEDEEMPSSAPLPEPSLHEANTKTYSDYLKYIVYPVHAVIVSFGAMLSVAVAMDIEFLSELAESFVALFASQKAAFLTIAVSTIVYAIGATMFHNRKNLSSCLGCCSADATTQEPAAPLASH